MIRVRMTKLTALALLCAVVAFPGSAQKQNGSLVMRQLAAESLPAFAKAFNAALAAGTLPDGRTFVSFHITGAIATQPLSTIGIADGDVLLKVDDYSIHTAEMARKLVGEAQPGADLKLTVARGGKAYAFAIEIIPARAPASPSVPEQAAPAPKAAPRQPATAAPAQGIQGDTMVLSEKALEQALEGADPLQMLADAQVQFVQDDNGNVLGLMSPRFSDIPLSASLGLRSGDIIRAVNGMGIDSELAVFDIIDKLNGQKQFAAQILRNGKPLLLKYRVQ